MRSLRLSLGILTSLLSTAPGCSPGMEWKTFRSTELGFQMRHPADWQVHEAMERRSPVVSFFEGSGGDEPPESPHATERRAYVLVLPRGLGTERVFGETGEVNLDLAEELDRTESKRYFLEDGETWAWYLAFESPPPAWNEYGFVWATAGIEDGSSRCRREGEPIPREACDPMMGDTVVRGGSVPREQREIIERMLGTFELLPVREEPQSPEGLELDEPRPGQTVASPFTVRGEARGTWFFEGVFPVRLLADEGNVLESGTARALSDWMTDELVPFEAELSFPEIAAGEATLVLERANPSGRPETAESYEIPLVLE